MPSGVLMHCDALSDVAGCYRVHWDMDFEICNKEYEQSISHRLRGGPIPIIDHFSHSS